MFLPVSFFIGLRYSRSQSRTGFVSFITFFSIAGILLGVASLITVVSVMNGFEGELKKRILGIVPHVVVSYKKTDGKAVVNTTVNTQPIIIKKSEKRMLDWQLQRELLLQQNHVKQVTPFLESEALIQSETQLKGIMLQGILPEYEQHNIINTHMVAGSLSSLSERAYNIVIGQALARTLDVGLGATLRLVLPNQTIFTPMGRIPVQRTFTVSGVFNVGSEVDDLMVYVHSRYGAKLIRQKGDGISHLRLYLDDAFNAKQVAAKLPLDKSKFQLTTWNDSQGALFSAVNMEKNMMWLMLSLIIAVAAFNIVSALVMVVIEKQGEIGILQTLGMDRMGILKIFITQGMFNGFFGVLLGAILGVLLTLNLNGLLDFLGISILGAGYGDQNLPMQLEISNVVVIVLSALVMSFIATLYPAYRASTTQPAEVLRNE
ncbi:MAG: lipoprotein-releasing system permease protein [Alteromonadaceae bacterium]|jgi:lipoprotein-releasing system permease protein